VLLYKTSNGGSDWTTQTVSAGPYYANAVSAPSSTVAWVGGTGRKVERTIDGGTTWQNVSPVFTEVGSLFEVQALYAWDDLNCVAFSSTGAIAKTVDGGETWVLKPGSVGQELRSVSFSGSDVPTSIGYAVGGNRNAGMPTLLKSVNGGELWTSISYGTDSLDIEDQAAGVVFDRFVTGFSSSYSAGTYVYGRWTNTKLEAKFKGTKVRWIGPKQPSYGMADVYIDGVKKATVDCYAAAGSLSETLFESAVLANTYHVLEIRLTGAKNAASSGNVVVLDRFEVEGVAPSGVGSRLNEQGAYATFTGTWIKAVNPTYTSKTYAYSAWAGPVYTASFTGTKVAWIGPKSLAYGRANVYIDGVFKGTVDCYSSATGWRYRIWESATLSPTSHTIQIKPTRTKSAASTNYVVVVDALDVAP
jgi:hypothetical protein